MNELLNNNRLQITTLCRKHHVRRLELFGSATSKEFDTSSSDIDFLVDFEHLERGSYSDHYFGLLEDLESLLGRKVDLVVVRAVKNPYFLKGIEQSRELLYAA